MSVQAIEPVEVDVPETRVVQVDIGTGSEPEAIRQGMMEGFGRIAVYTASHGLELAGPPRSVYTAYGPDETRYTLAFPVAEGAPDPGPVGGVSIGKLSGGRMLRFEHTGPYDELMGAYGLITQWMVANGHMESDAGWADHTPMWEEYVNDPDSTPPEALLTYIYVPV
ncbi:MAG TPA: GyrI-like domain-containing protein [Longimicrobiales bacterium]|nr:GyrI-like domain-containing protein [Longimicrobiales bacterium]